MAPVLCQMLFNCVFQTFKESTAHADRVLDYLRCRGAKASILFRYILTYPLVKTLQLNDLALLNSPLKYSKIFSSVTWLLIIGNKGGYHGLGMECLTTRTHAFVKKESWISSHKSGLHLLTHQVAILQGILSSIGFQLQLTVTLSWQSEIKNYFNFSCNAQNCRVIIKVRYVFHLMNYWIKFCWSGLAWHSKYLWSVKSQIGW